MTRSEWRGTNDEGRMTNDEGRETNDERRMTRAPEPPKGDNLEKRVDGRSVSDGRGGSSGSGGRDGVEGWLLCDVKWKKVSEKFYLCGRLQNART